jgi:hypothetical protein
MGKRSGFSRIPKDKYASTLACVIPLLPHLAPGTVFAEPCAGNGALIDLLVDAGHRCVWATDTAPERADIGTLPGIGVRNIAAKVVITNPPWTRSAMHPIIDALSAMLPCWFLFDADWAHTRQSADLILRCSRIIPVGRIKWIPDSEHVGKDNCCWHEFLPGHTAGPHFLPRGAIPSHALMGPEERRRAAIVPEPVTGLPLFAATKGKDHGSKKKTRRVQLVPEADAMVERQREVGEAAPDRGSLPDPESDGRDRHGASLQSMQQVQGRHAAGGVAGVHASASAMVAKLRSRLRPVVHPRITPGAIGEN